MKVTRLEEAEVIMSNENFIGRRVHAFPSAALIHMTVHPGRRVEPHAADVDMGFFVVRGIGFFSIGDEEAVAEQGAFVESPAGVVHGISNIGDGPLELVVVKANAATA
jgi:mannose-6-phosphate isomerase-like protein (cupin superfamily)